MLQNRRVGVFEIQIPIEALSESLPQPTSDVLERGTAGALAGRRTCSGTARRCDGETPLFIINGAAATPGGGKGTWTLFRPLTQPK